MDCSPTLAKSRKASFDICLTSERLEKEYGFVLNI